jgi:single-strand DNA-binding protein
MNNLTIGGSLGRDAELKHLSNGDPVLSFSVADSQGGKEKPTIWWNCSLFGKRAESLQQYLMKGQNVTISGTLTKREWKDRESGINREALDLRVNDVLLQGGKPNANQAPSHPASAAKPSSGGAFSDMDEDIPFAPIPRKALTSI